MKIQEFDVIRAIKTVHVDKTIIPKDTQADVVDLTMVKSKPSYILEFFLNGSKDRHLVQIGPSKASSFALIARERDRFDPPLRFSGDAVSLKRALEATSGAPSAVALKKPKYSNKPKNSR